MAGTANSSYVRPSQGSVGRQDNATDSWFNLYTCNHYDELLSVLVEVIKAQQTLIEKLEQRVHEPETASDQ